MAVPVVDLSMRMFPVSPPAAVGPGANTVDVLETGQMDLVINYAVTLPSDTAKLRFYTHCLSQALSTQGALYKGKCESMLRELFFLLAKTRTNIGPAIDVLADPKYSFDPRMKGILEELTYYNSSCCEQVLQHSANSCCNRGSRGASCFITGISFVVIGSFSQFLSEDARVRNVGRAAITAGALMMAAPLFHGIAKWYKGKP